MNCTYHDEITGQNTPFMNLVGKTGFKDVKRHNPVYSETYGHTNNVFTIIKFFSYDNWKLETKPQAFKWDFFQAYLHILTIS